MQEFFQFVGGYWWLVFPLLGVLGGAGRAWERGARRRHQRRLEVLHAKAELKAAAAAGRALPATAPITTTSVGAGAGATASAPAATQLERLLASHDAVTARWLEYELDVAKIIAFPAMSDGRQPLTAAFLRAKKMADGLRPASPKARLSREQLAEYRNAVTDYEVAFDVAERDARRIKDSSFSVVERKRLDTAKQLLSVAIDQAATPAERQLAYRRVREELDGLISLSDEAIEVLEHKVTLELTTGAQPRVPDAAAPASTAPPAPSAGATPSPSPGPVPQSASPPLAEPLPLPMREPKTGPWPVPARGTNTAPGRVTHPKPQP
ncbi:hypothetical protein [Microbacterium rhizomatis]|uniref:Uncharacterized protein n=1 Tax=Microbacterium rhizomatis TaxID=1631477 RepID=A0A5J5IYS4_9MICO|nr:hypothetical protein F6B43_14465 [Microbacterium rhizomatis]